MAAIPSSNRLDEPDIHPRQRLARFQLIGRQFEEIIDSAHGQPDAAGADIDHQERALVFRNGRPVQQPMAVDNGEKRPPDIHEPDDGVRGPGNPGCREGRENLAGAAGKHPAGQIAHLKNDDAHRLGVSHLY